MEYIITLVFILIVLAVAAFLADHFPTKPTGTPLDVLEVRLEGGPTEEQFQLCHECAVAVVNDDWSSYDLDVDRLREFLDVVGRPLALESRTGMDAPEPCEACFQLIGEGEFGYNFDVL